MTSAKFKVGEMVDFNPARSVVPASIQKYEVLKLLPRERGEQHYRIKSKAEAFARIAKESDLSARKD